jgi:EmrB/QacA subfamily drug resistance transporter
MTNDTNHAEVRWALAALSLPMLMASLDTSIANIALPTLAHAFTASFQAVQWIVLAYLLAITTLIVSAGRLGDLLGRRRLLLAGIALFTLASLACGVAPNLPVLLAARAAQGVGAAIMMALSLAFVGATVPSQQTGSAMGLLGTMSAIGTALGPTLGGLFIAGPGWRAIFLVNVPVGLVNMLLAYRYLPADRTQPGASPAGLDVPGTLLLASTLAAYALAMTSGSGVLGRPALLLLLAALAGALLFALVEARAASPLIRLAMFRDRILSASLVMSALVSTVMMSTLVVGPFYLSHALGLRPALIGILLSVGPIVVAMSSVLAGRLADRFRADRTARAGLLGIALGATSLSLLPARFGIPGYLLPIVVLTASYALFQTSNNTVVMMGVDAAQRGVVSGMLNLSRNLGLITGASVMGAVFAHGAGTGHITAASPAAVAAGMRITFATAAGLMAVALALSPAGRPRSRPGATALRARSNP